MRTINSMQGWLLSTVLLFGSSGLAASGIGASNPGGQAQVQNTPTSATPTPIDPTAAANALVQAIQSMPNAVTTAATSNVALPAAGGGGLDFDSLASGLESFSNGGISSVMPAVSTGVALLQSASSILALIPGLGGISDAINHVLDAFSGAASTLAPIMAVAKTIGHYMRLVSDGQKTLGNLMNARSLDDAMDSVNALTGLAGQAGLINTAQLKGNPVAVADAVADTFDAQINATMAQQRQYSNMPQISAAIGERVKRLQSLRALTMRKLNAQARMNDVTASNKRAADLAGSTAQNAMILTTTASTVTNEKDAAKVNVAATTEVANATAAGLANVSDQLTQQSALTVQTNESLDQLVESNIEAASARAMKHEMDMQSDDAADVAQYRATVQIGRSATAALGNTLSPQSNQAPDFAAVLRNKK
ncbi:hypothetical protein [Deinococcus ruber]|uniref:Uncharacterized protein n=1 Tax=Deinococcus ruber TaxID=1848197 RepID=A0A918C949_9DEIO|nr:hypothetical protein [Deinococcus ruber]GGR09733.1 hypothetical protein GCM10008957_23110 [Deinococcus ruber]